MKRLRMWWTTHTDRYRLRVVAIIALTLGSVLPPLVAVVRGTSLEDFALIFGIEMLGTLITFLILDHLLVPGEETAPFSPLTGPKADLIAQLGSPIHAVAKSAAETLLHRDWIVDGSLEGVYLNHANLREVYLGSANLGRASIAFANLQEAHLGNINLQDANLTGSNLQGAVLRGANLRGTQLQRANLQDAVLTNAIFDEGTVLPDGSYWTPGTDMARFADPHHKAFWHAEQHAYPAREK